MYKFSLSFFLYSFVGSIANIYLSEENLGIVNLPIKGKKQYVSHAQKRTYSLNIDP